MNLDDYRAMKEAEANPPVEEKAHAQTNENTVVDAEQIPQAQAESAPAPSHEGAEDSSQVDARTSEEVDIDGQKVSIDELKSGYLRQSDYTRKTQELARSKKELEKAEQVYQAMHKDAETAQEVSERLGIEYVSPQQAEILEMQSKYQELVLERELEKLQAKYGEFDVTEVLQLAYDKRIDDIEDAYLLVAGRRTAEQKQPNSLDIEALKAQIRQELSQELQSNVDTSSLISTSGNTKQVMDDSPQLSHQEMRVASAMKMSATDYAKWKNNK